MARIFVLDDDEQLLRMLGMMLERGGHTPILENNPVRAVERIKVEKPDGVIVDIMMPIVTGHAICQKIRATESIAKLPILVLTARSQPIDRKTALESGADDYLSKPVSPKELLSHVNDLLQLRASPPRPDGSIISILGLRGGVGRTTLAVNLAAALRRVSQQDCCLIDLSPSGGQVALHLRMTATNTWANLPSVNQLDGTTLKNHLHSHPSGLQLLAAPLQPQLPIAPSGELVAAVLAILRKEMVFTILDLPSLINPAVEVALPMSDVVLHVVAPEVISAQMAAQTSLALARDEVKLNQMFVLNQNTPDMPLSPETIERGLKSRLAFKIPYDTNQSRAMAQGAPLGFSTSQSPLPVMVGRIAEAMWQRVSKGEGLGQKGS